jgi:hypothetical protein
MGYSMIENDNRETNTSFLNERQGRGAPRLRPYPCNGPVFRPTKSELPTSADGPFPARLARRQRRPIRLNQRKVRSRRSAPVHSIVTLATDTANPATGQYL